MALLLPLSIVTIYVPSDLPRILLVRNTFYFIFHFKCHFLNLKFYLCLLVEKFWWIFGVEWKEVIVNEVKIVF